MVRSPRHWILGRPRRSYELGCETSTIVGHPPWCLARNPVRKDSTMLQAQVVLIDEESDQLPDRMSVESRSPLVHPRRIAALSTQTSSINSQTCSKHGYSSKREKTTSSQVRSAGAICARVSTSIWLAAAFTTLLPTAYRIPTQRSLAGRASKRLCQWFIAATLVL